MRLPNRPLKRWEEILIIVHMCAVAVFVIMSIYALILVLLWSPKEAAGQALYIPPSKVEFTVKHLVLGKVRGRFREFHGELEDGRLRGTVAVDSLYTGNEDRDRHLLSKSFFSAAIFPEIAFSGDLVMITETEGIVIGYLTIKGNRVKVELEAYKPTAHRQKGEIPVGRRTASNVYYLKGTINRFDFGVDWNKTFAGTIIVDSKVMIDLKLIFK